MRRQIVADDHARRVINRLEAGIDVGHDATDALECGPQHGERRRIAFRGAVSAAESLGRGSRVGEAFERVHARHAGATRGSRREVARRQRAAAMKHDIAGREQAACREHHAARDDLVVRRRQHPRFGAAHLSDSVDRASLADERNRCLALPGLPI
jgi:hypothetical protein